MEKKETKSYWSPGGQIFFTGGFAFGVHPLKGTVFLGKEKDIVQLLAEETLTQNPVIAQVLLLERECLRKASGDATRRSTINPHKSKR